VTDCAAPDAAAINAHLATRTTVLGAKPSVADLATYAACAPLVARLAPEQRTAADTGLHHLVRHVAYVQGAPVFGIADCAAVPETERVAIDLDDVRSLPKPVVAKKEEKEKKEKKGRKAEKETAAAAAAAPAQAEAVVDQTQTQELPIRTKKEATPTGTPPLPTTQKKEKKAKQPKQQKAPAAPAAPPSPSVIDLRVGHILRAVTHPNADSLYVSTIDCGDAPGTENTALDEATGKTVRTVCSGLNGLVPLAEMQGRKIVAVCNLKPVTMRGIKSCAMVLAASPRLAEGEEDHHAGPVELVTPPEGLAAGTRLFFENWKEGTPEKVLNPKKKVWEAYAPGFTTTEGLEVAFDPSAVEVVKGLEAAGKGLGKLTSEQGGVCTVKTLKGAVVR
ncbi:G4 quadruplex nucleic acid binding protein, partial [Ascosphaera acerosa]